MNEQQPAVKQHEHRNERLEERLRKIVEMILKGAGEKK